MKKSCPCGGIRYSQCCAPLHLGVPAVYAEQLMRARYSAYALNKPEYVLATWHADTRPQMLDCSGSTRWLGLEVLVSAPGIAESFVEFIAHYREGDGRAMSMRERSRFLRIDGSWQYVDGVLIHDDMPTRVR